MLPNTWEVRPCKFSVVFPCSFIIGMSGFFPCYEKSQINRSAIDPDICSVFTTSVKAYAFETTLICRSDNFITSIFSSCGYPKIRASIITRISANVINDRFPI